MKDNNQLEADIEIMRSDFNRAFKTHRAELRKHKLQIDSLIEAIHAVSPEVSKKFSESYSRNIKVRDAMDENARNSNPPGEFFP